MSTFVRWQSPTPTAYGLHRGVFSLVSQLWKAGELSPTELAFRQENNAWYDAAYAHPPVGVYGPGNPSAVSWFRAEHEWLFTRLPGYLAILDTHGVAWERRESSDPGRVLHADEHQVVVVPHEGRTGPPTHSVWDVASRRGPAPGAGSPPARAAAAG